MRVRVRNGVFRTGGGYSSKGASRKSAGGGAVRLDRLVRRDQLRHCVAQSRGLTTGFDGVFELAGSGYSVGVQGGYNWQLNPGWVAGIEADINWLGIERSLPDWATFAITLRVETDWYGTARGRIGYTTGPSLFYFTGGVAFVSLENRVTTSGGTVASNSGTASGWTAGGGIETMLGGNWSAKVEYLYIDAGDRAVSNPSVAGGAPTIFDNRVHVFRKGLNYRFGGSGAATTLPAHDWTGFYAGVNAGAGATQIHATSVAITGEIDNADFAPSVGVQAGVNWQLAPRWVAGFEADIGWLGIDHAPQNWFTATVNFGVETDWFGTARARFGYTAGPALLYVTGGLAGVHVTNIFDDSLGGGIRASSSKVALGWTWGGGIEAALGGNWTAKTEYLFIDAGHQDVFNPNIAGGDTARFDNRFHVFRFGLNYKFASGKAPGPVVTKY